MSIYHLSVKPITRGRGKSAVAAICYRAGIKAENLYEGSTYDYTRKKWITHTEQMLPEHVAYVCPEYSDFETFWNAVELSEKNSSARLSREVEISLPKEMELKDQIELIRDYCQKNFVDKGMVASICLHSPPRHDDLNRALDRDGNPTTDISKMIFENPHAHVMLSVRPIDIFGKFEPKSQIEYVCRRGNEERRFTSEEFQYKQNKGWEKQYKYLKPDAKNRKDFVWLTPSQAESQGLDNSNRLGKQPKTSPYGRQNPALAEWNDRARVLEWRKSWETMCNDKLKELGIDESIDCRSLKDQGIDRIPSITLGPEAMQMERRRQRLEREGKNPSKGSNKGKIQSAIDGYNKAASDSKAIEKAVTQKLSHADRRIKDNRYQKSKLSGQRQALVNELDRLRRLADEDADEQEKINDALGIILSLNQRAMVLIGELQKQYSDTSVCDVPKRESLKKQIASEQQKIKDRNEYKKTLERNLCTMGGSIQKTEIDYDYLCRQCEDLQREINSLDKEHRDLIDSIPKDYLKELSEIQKAHRAAPEAAREKALTK